jgi:hypothetical protein
MQVSLEGQSSATTAVGAVLGGHLPLVLQAHPIEGTLAGLNSRFYLDRHAR